LDDLGDSDDALGGKNRGKPDGGKTKEKLKAKAKSIQVATHQVKINHDNQTHRNQVGYGIEEKYSQRGQVGGYST
jgi:hypothetical protein